MLYDRLVNFKLRIFDSKYFKVKTGVGQGSIFGPLVWSLYINDISSVLLDKYVCYADDLVIFGTGEDVNQLTRNFYTKLLV